MMYIDVSVAPVLLERGPVHVKRKAMTWVKVVFDSKDSDITATSVNAFMNHFDKAYRAAGVPEEAKIYQLMTHSARRVLYLSPKAAAIARAFLSEYKDVSEMDSVPDTTDLQQLKT